MTTATIGTVTHMAPELLQHGKLRQSGDVYAFGIMLWQ
jgi:mitogen-activated protein kinase kinase kinase 11